MNIPPNSNIIQQQQQQQAKTLSINDLIKTVEDKMKALGPGPYNTEQQLSYNKLVDVLQKAREKHDIIRMHEQTNIVVPTQPVQIQQQQPQTIQLNQQQIAQLQQQQIQLQLQEQQRQHQHLHQQEQQKRLFQQQAAAAATAQQSTQSSYASSSQQQQQQLQQQASSLSSSTQFQSQVLDKRALQELVKEIDPSEQLDEDVEDILLQIADDFIDNVITSSCQIAKHRKSNVLETKDVQFHLERNWNIWIPGFGSDELKPFKKSYSTEAHKQRVQLIKKSNKTSTDTKDKIKE